MTDALERIAAALERIADAVESAPPARGRGARAEANGGLMPAPALPIAEVLELAKIDDVTRARARAQVRKHGLGRPKPKR